MLLSGFRQIQYDFAAHIRDPENVSGPDGIEDRRMAVYRDLFYNNVENFMATGFPVLRSLYDEDAWHLLIRDYFSRHNAKTPHFPEMAGEFVYYLLNEFIPGDNDPAFIYELAHYEWMETALSLSKDCIADVSFNSRGDLRHEPVVISPLAWLLSYEWPVHTISRDYRPTEKPDQPTWIIIYRDAQDDVGFIQLNPVTSRLFQLLEDESRSLSGEQALELVAQELNHPRPEVIISGGMDTLKQLRAKDIVLGTAIIRRQAE